MRNEKPRTYDTDLIADLAMSFKNDVVCSASEYESISKFEDLETIVGSEIEIVHEDPALIIFKFVSQEDTDILVVIDRRSKRQLLTSCFQDDLDLQIDLHPLNLYGKEKEREAYMQMVLAACKPK